MLGSYCPNLQFRLSADMIKTLILLLKHFTSLWSRVAWHHRSLSCGAFLPDELLAELSYIFYTDNFIFKNPKYFWDSFCHPHTFPLFSLPVGGNLKLHQVVILEIMSNSLPISISQSTNVGICINIYECYLLHPPVFRFVILKKFWSELKQLVTSCLPEVKSSFHFLSNSTK